MATSARPSQTCRQLRYGPPWRTMTTPACSARTRRSERAVTRGFDFFKKEIAPKASNWWGRGEHNNREPPVTLRDLGERRQMLCVRRFGALFLCALLCVDTSPIPISARPHPSRGSRSTSKPLPARCSRMDKSLCLLKLYPDLRRPEKRNYQGSSSSPCTAVTCHVPRRGNEPG